MYCLLCHEKIPRLRAWRTKSEFCCDEHAALYKKQTLERLLVDPGAASTSGQASLPEPPEPEDFESEDFDAELTAETYGVHGSGESAQAAERHGFLPVPSFEEDALELPEPADTDSTEGMDELWRLAGGLGETKGYESRFAPMDRADGSTAPGVNRQSAEEALEALRNLANRAAARDEEPEEPGRRRPVFEMPGPAAERPEDAFDESALLREIQAVDEPEEQQGASSLDETKQDTPTSAAPKAAGADDDSGLDRLFAEPISSWSDSADDGVLEPFDEPQALREHDVPEPEVILEQETQPEQADFAGGAAEALEEMVGELEGAPTASAADLEAPEPDWDFADASSDLSLLKATLESTGSPAMRVDPELADLDVSPEEPAWEEFHALDLDESDIDPPAPELEDDSEVASPQAEAPVKEEAPDVSAAKAATNGIAAGSRKSHVRRKPASRFRAVTELAEIQLEIADWPRGGSDAAGEPALTASAAAESRGRGHFEERLDIAAPEPAAMYLPSGAASASQGGAWSMYESSVEIEPQAVLDTSSPGELRPPAGPASSPFEPVGLFFDMAGSGGSAQGPRESAADKESETGVPAGGPRQGS